MSVRDVIGSADAKMQKAVEHLQDELRSVRTGRATTALVDGLTVDVYGQAMPLKSLATISTPDARTITITPWDRSNLAPVEKVIRETQSLGLTPNNDGTNIRLNIPPLTEERRREIVKTVGEKVEGAHIAMRNIRHELLDEVKKLERDKQATQDDVKFAENELNKKIDQFREKVSEVQKAKEKEVMEV